MKKSTWVLLVIIAVLAVALAIVVKNKKKLASVEDATANAAAADTFEGLDFTQLPEDYAEAMAVITGVQPWDARKDARPKQLPEGDPRTYMELKMTSELLDQSFALGSAFLVNWQLPPGNFRYMYDWLDGTWVEDDNQVRQAGSLWGVALCHRYRPTPETRAALDKGLKFWFDSTIDGPNESLTCKYKEDRAISSGTVALVALSIVEYLMTDEPMEEDYEAELTTKLEGYLKFLVYMQRSNGHFSRDYRLDRASRVERSSPYYDGETLLCLCKAARELGYTDLVPTIESAARAMAETYTVKAWAKDRDSKKTKGFYQWSSMAFAEYYQAQWKEHELYGDVALSLGWWMTHTHATLKKNRNHAYAVEGLISAYRIARWRGDVDAQIDLLYTLDRSLHKLGSWQINGPLAGNNKFLGANPTDDPLAHGGIMNARKKSGREVSEDVAHQLRIDVTQHQMHATTLALEFVYAEQELSGPWVND